MTYSPFEIRVLPILFYYIFLSTFGVLVSIKMYYKWRERKVPPPLYLTLVFSLLSLALIMLSIGLAEAAITGFYKEVYRFSLPFGYSMVIVANIFLFIFSSNITNKGKKAFNLIIIISVIIIILLFLPWNWWGVPSEDYAGKLNIRLFSTVSLVVYSYSIYGYIAFICRKIKPKTENKVMSVGLSLLFYSMISLMLLFLMLIADTLMIILFDHPGYSDFTYIAWIFGMTFIILIYLSLIMPDWLVNWINKKYGD
ncbi:MAG: hypothetical protein ACFFA6_14615 [Promethearchaeota archaeon]